MTHQTCHLRRCSGLRGKGGLGSANVQLLSWLLLNAIMAAEIQPATNRVRCQHKGHCHTPYERKEGRKDTHPLPFLQYVFRILVQLLVSAHWFTFHTWISYICQCGFRKTGLKSKSLTDAASTFTTFRTVGIPKTSLHSPFRFDKMILHLINCYSHWQFTNQMIT